MVVVTAGAHQEPGETRLDLVGKNAAIFKELVPAMVGQNRKAVYIVVSNPVDVCTYLMLKYSRLSPSQVFGTGTSLDTARLRFMLGQHFKVSPGSVHAYMLGEHGDSSFPVWSAAMIGGAPLKDVKGYSKGVLDSIAKRTKDAAYEVIAKQGATYYAVSLVVTELVKAVVQDRKEVLPLSVYLGGYKGLRDVCLSVPVVLGRKGVEQVIDIPLSGEERRLLGKSAAFLKRYLKGRGDGSV